MSKNLKKRFWEIDFLRGAAIIMMIVFHFLYDLNYFGAYNVNVNSGFWLYFARAIAIIFLVLVGISLTLSFSRAKRLQKTGKSLYIKYLKRGLIVFSWGMLITLMTWIFLRQGFVVFGILHVIGISIILAYPFLRFRFLNLFIGIIFIMTGIFLKNLTFDFYWLMWLGLRPEQFYTLDYFPLLPWFGVILIGIFLGNLLYQGYERRFRIYDLSKFPFINLFCFMGRNSLLIYLIHQPTLIAILYVFGMKGGPLWIGF